MKFLDAFDPTRAAMTRSAAFSGWATIAGWFQSHGYEVDVSRRLTEVRAFWAGLAPEKRARVRMPPAQDPQYHDPAEDDVIVLTASRQGEGKVATIGIKRVWLSRPLADCMGDLSFWYGAQARAMAAQGRRCEVTAAAAFELESVHIGWIGGGMNVGTDQAVYKALARAALFYAATHWEVKALLGIVERSTFRLHGWNWYGFKRAELGVWRDDLEFLLASLPRRDLVAAACRPGFCDVERSLAGFARADRVPPAASAEFGAIVEEMAVV